MLPRLTLCLSLFCLGGCATMQSVRVPQPTTLTRTARLPGGEIERNFSPTQWLKLRDLEIEAYVSIEAQIRSDGTVLVGNIVETFPDPSWHNLARALTRGVELRAATVGSNLNPRAEVHVIFFKRSLDGNLALVFGRQKEEPGPGMDHKATYLHTLHY